MEKDSMEMKEMEEERIKWRTKIGGGMKRGRS